MTFKGEALVALAVPVASGNVVHDKGSHEQFATGARTREICSR